MANRDEYAERAARDIDDFVRGQLTEVGTVENEREKYARIIAEVYAPLHEKLARANGMIETMNESMKRLESELTRTASDRDEWRRLAESYDGDRVGAQQELARVTEERDIATRFLARRGYKRCDIPAWNCDSWHGGDFEERFREIADLLDTNGKTPPDAVRELIEERDRLREQIEDRDWARDKD